jgi:hypothetical protein
LQFLGGRRNALFVSDLKLETSVRDRSIRGPILRAEASFGGLRERPDAKMLAALDARTEIIIVAAFGMSGHQTGFSGTAVLEVCSTPAHVARAV